MDLRDDIPTDQTTSAKAEPTKGGAIVAAVAGICLIAVLIMLTVKLGLVLFT